MNRDREGWDEEGWTGTRTGGMKKEIDRDRDRRNEEREGQGQEG
jgi:hypothetical protein